MATININVPGVTVVVNGETIDINSNYQQGMPYPFQPHFQYGQQYPGWQGPNVYPQQRYNTYPGQSGEQQYNPQQPTVYRHQSNSIIGKGFIDSTFTDESLLSLFRSLQELTVYVHHVNTSKPETTRFTSQTTEFTTKSITLVYIKNVPVGFCLTLTHTDKHDTTPKSNVPMETFCKDTSGLWLSKKEVVYLKSDNSINKPA